MSAVPSQINSLISAIPLPVSMPSGLSGIISSATLLPSQSGSSAASASSSELVPQQERLATIRPRTAIRGFEDQHAYIKIANYSTSKGTTKTNSVGVQNALTSAAGFSNFIVTGWRFAQRERSQIIPVFGGGAAAYFFGSEPVILELQGLLTDDVDNQWFYQFMLAYQNFLRGTVLAQKYEEATFYLPSMTITGPILGLDVSQDASRWVDIPFSMTVLIREFEVLPVVTGGLTSLPIALQPYPTTSPTLSIGAANQVKSLAASLGVGDTVSEGLGALLIGGSPSPISANAVLGLSANLLNLSTGLIPSTAGFLTTPNSKVFGFLQEFSGYVQDAAQFLQTAISSTGIGALASLIVSTGQGIASTITSLDQLLGTTVSSFTAAVNPLTSLPTAIAQAIYAPLAALQHLSFDFNSFIAQLIALPQTYANQVGGLFQTAFSALLPLAPAVPVNNNAFLTSGASAGVSQVAML